MGKQRVVLPDRYQILAELGQGGMGAVYKAHDSYLGQDVSIKILKKTNSLESQAIRFQQEAKILSQLTHDNLATVLDFGTTTDNNFYMVTKFIDAINLKDYIKTNASIPISDILIILEQLTSCLNYVHSKGIYHRDIKSTNILIDSKDGRIKTFILDFGIAKPDQQKLLEENLTATGMIIGTPEYLSPEQALGQKVDQRSDVYSLGCVAFELVTGRLPFTGKSNLDVIYKHIEDVPPKITEVSNRKDIPEDLENLVNNMLEKDLDKRYRDMKTVQSELKNITPLPTPSEINESERKQDQTEVLFRSEQLEKRKPGLFIYVSTLVVIASTCYAILHTTNQNEIKKTEFHIKQKGFEEEKKAADKTVEAHSETMSVSKTRFHIEDYSTSIKRKKLMVVKVITDDSKSPIDWNQLSQFKKDFLLDTKEITLDRESLVKILSFPNLKAFTFTNFKSDNNQCFKLICDKRKDLIFLVVSSIRDLKPESFKNFNSFTNLGKLELERCNLNREKVSALPVIKTLSALKIEDDPTFDDIVFSSMISKFPNLNKLDINHCNFTGKYLDQLGKSPKITILDFTRTKIDDQGINQLVKAKIKLKTIDLTNTLISKNGFMALNKAKYLKKVTISDCQFLTEHQISAFSKTMNFKTTNKSILN